MNVVLTLLAICGLVASAIGVARTWRDGRKLRRDFEQVVAEKRVNR